MRSHFLLVLATSFYAHLTLAADPPDLLARQVREAETGFARSMTERNAVAFATFIAADAVFFGDKTLRGKAAVVAGWQGFFEGPVAPFSWSAETVEVLDSGTLAHSSGPVLDKQGQRVGTFNSIWRREADGSWKVVFDKGCDACRCK
jgi:ketosteroid isomerase-like protein